MMFSLFPDVEIPIATSPVLPIASIWREKTLLKPRSLPVAVRTEVSVESDRAGIAFLFSENLTTSSVARCWASAALPPFPKKSNFFFFF